MKVAYVSLGMGAVPAWCAEQLKGAGIELGSCDCSSPEKLRSWDFAQEAQVFWFWGPNPCLPAEALASFPNLRALFRSGSGVDCLPCAAARERGIEILNTPESISESVAEHAAALLISLARNIPLFSTRVRAGFWDDATYAMPRHMTGRTLGLVGYGRIARRLEELLAGFKLKVVHFDPFSPNSIPLDELLKAADFISIHCPLTDETRHLIGVREFALMKPEALLVNTSRGPVLDEAALIDALRTKHIAGAAIDVTDPEPPSENSPLFALDNLIVSPHIAAFSTDFEKNFWQFSADKLIAFAKHLGA